MNDDFDEDPPEAALVALRDGILRRFSEVPSSEHYFVVYLIGETAQFRSDLVCACLNDMAFSTNKAASAWARALLFTLCHDETYLELLATDGSLADVECPGFYDAMLPILGEASKGSRAALNLVERIIANPETSQLAKDFVRSRLYDKTQRGG